jgi:hypothetical protein
MEAMGGESSEIVKKVLIGDWWVALLQSRIYLVITPCITQYLRGISAADPQHDPLLGYRTGYHLLSLTFDIGFCFQGDKKLTS